MRDYYWYRRGGFVLAVDATSKQDADSYVHLHNGDMDYLGKHAQGTNYTTACCGTTTKRQDEISRNLRRNEVI